MDRSQNHYMDLKIIIPSLKDARSSKSSVIPFTFHSRKGRIYMISGLGFFEGNFTTKGHERIKVDCGSAGYVTIYLYQNASNHTFGKMESITTNYTLIFKIQSF